MSEFTLNKPMLVTIGIIGAMFTIASIIFALIVVFAGPNFTKIGKKECKSFSSELFMIFEDKKEHYAICKKDKGRFFIIELHETNDQNP